MPAVQGSPGDAPFPGHPPIEITFIIRGGPPTTVDGIESTLERVLCRAVTYHVHRRLGDLLCPTHHQRPRVIASGPSADHLTYKVAGCCQALIDIATARLG
jgi:hypothetical protein